MGDSEVDPKRFQLIDQLLDAVFELEDHQIPAYLDQACAGDQTLRTEIERLIASDKRDRALMNSPAFQAAADMVKEDHDTPVQMGAQTLFSLLAQENSNKTPLSARTLIAGRYELISRLGKGGMGEVWHAYDVKLRVDVALKSLRFDFKGSQDPLEFLRREVRTAREVVSTNVCRIFDLVSEEEGELISMEHIDGITLMEMMAQKGPLELRDAIDIAAQFLAGLDAIHTAGLVHRDLKPENIMITRSGRVVVMDLGIAQPQAQSGGTISGTLPYMSPEQLRGDQVDARSDIFSAGVVLAEMIYTKGTQSKETREIVWQAIRKDPMQLPDSPWKEVIARAVAEDKENRFESATGLARALEEITVRGKTIEDRTPYPGLSSFSSGDSEYFLGREQEVESLIKKLHQLHLMALIGPSGAGKTSFLQAGLIPALPENWGCVLMNPGGAPMLNLQHGLTPFLLKDEEANSRMIRFEEPDTAIWILCRALQAYKEFVLIVDRFEELFTLSSSEVQSHFADFLARATLEANIRVLLVMRDDFFIFCKEHLSLAPVFSELTGMVPLTGAALRRALVQPALKCGYKFEDEILVHDILSDVEKERGALPLLAFAASLLWEKRDRSKGQLTRQAYKDIGEVRGALAQHAENTMQRIGVEKESIVHEIFRNLITAQNTRVARDTEELSSVFQGQASLPAAKEVIRILIDARLLTSFENRIEITHESLISNWPRLVKWQTQDAENAQMRDELRQAAQLWNQKGRPQDLLWAGAAFLEFQLWQQRYPSGLTATEKAFAEATTQHATKKRRQRRMMLATMFVVLLLTLAVIGNFWYKESIARKDAVAESKQAQASKLLVIGRSLHESDTATKLGYNLASLEIADTENARQFAGQVLSQGLPPFTLMKANFPAQIFFSPDSKWFAVLDYMRFGTDAGLQLFSQDGSAPTMITKDATLHTQFTKDRKFIVWTSNNDPRVIQVWSIPQRKIVRSFTMPGDTRLISAPEGDKVLLRTFTPEKKTLAAVYELTAGEHDLRFVGNFSTEETKWYLVNKQGNVIAYQKTDGIYFRSLGEFGFGPEKLLLKAEAKRGNYSFHPNGNFFVICDDKNTRIFSIIHETTTLVRVFPAIGEPWFDSIGRYLVIGTASRLLLWDLTAPADAEPTAIQHPLGEGAISIAFDSQGRWMVIAWGESSSIQFYPLPKNEPLVFRGSGGGAFNVRFTADGKSLINGFLNEGIRAFNISDDSKVRSGIIWKPSSGMTQPIDIDRSGKYLLVGTNGTPAFRIRIADGKTVELKRGLSERIYDSVAFSPDGLFGAGVAVHGSAEQHGIEIWDFQSNSVRVIEQSKGKASFCVKYAPDGSLFSGDSSGNVYRWNLKDDSHKVWKVGDGIVTGIAITNDGRYAAASSLTAKKWSDVPAATSEVVLYDLKNNTHTPILSHGNRVFRVAFDPQGTKLVTGDLDGLVRVGPITGEAPHLLIGHQNHIGDVVVDPTGKWIASAEYNKAIVRLWPMPEGKPLQTLSHQELINRLRKLTNIRVIADKSSSSGYTATMVPFEGWQEIPAFYLNR